MEEELLLLLEEDDVLKVEVVLRLQKEGNDERDQTVNQILVELYGFEGNPGVMTIAATARVDILDQALLHPGSFDRNITVDLKSSCAFSRKSLGARYKLGCNSEEDARL